MKSPSRTLICLTVCWCWCRGDQPKDNSDKLVEYYRWQSISSDGADTWSIPVYRTKDGEPNLVNKFRATGDVDYVNDEQGLEDDLIIPSTTSTPDATQRSVKRKEMGHMDVVTKFLHIVESQSVLGENCTAGTEMNLGKGVVDRYAQERFRLEAEVAVNRANFLTRLWKYAKQTAESSEYVLYNSVRSMVEFDDDIFAAGNCYDQYAYRDYMLFCPFGYKLPEGPILVKNLAAEYHYLTNASEWFFRARKSAERVIQNYTQFKRGFNKFSVNGSFHGEPVEDEILSVVYEDGRWSKPYFDCGGGNIWMLTYTVPFFGYDNGTYAFKGTSGIDIDLRRVDIDQCPQRAGSTELNIFASSDKCKSDTTRCIPISGLGFRRGSYKCLCKDGFYFPLKGAEHPYYNGSFIEEEFEKLVMGEVSKYEDEGAFQCLQCSEGCETCVDESPCIASLNWLLRTTILILTSVISAALPLVAWFTWKYGNLMVVKAASPVLLRIIILGAFFLYSTIIVMYPRPNVITCTLRVWLREMGFSLSYGALMLKTWRISVIFRVRSAKAVKITDWDLIKRLGFIVGAFAVFLAIRSLVAAPQVIVGRTADDLKAFLCSTNWWDHACSIFEVLFLVWGVSLCIMVRKAPSEFNESRFISMAIYNEFLLSVFLNISMIFLQSPANPDLLYIIFFCHSQLTITLLLALIFGSKAYMVMKGLGSKAEEGSSALSKPSTAKFLSRPKSQQNSASAAAGQVGTMLSSSSLTRPPTESSSSKPIELDVQEEFQQLYVQLSRLKERNLRVGNRQLADTITAMQMAANNSKQTNKNPEAVVPEVKTDTKLEAKLKDESSQETAIDNKSLAEVTLKDEEAVELRALNESPNHVSANGVSGSDVTTANSAQNSPGSHSGSRSGRHRRHRRQRIIINLDDKTRFTDEITV